MELPSRVFIMGHEFVIEPLPKELFDYTDTYGDCCTDKRVIRVYCETHLSVMRDTLLHEILHGVWSLLGLEKREEEEKAVNSMATLLIGCIDDPRNKEVIDFLINNATTTDN
jgi:hypothetical protein